jgi:anti-sigma factor RsiW
MSAHPDKLPLIHGLVDGELDAANALAIETHLRSCGDCRAELDRLQALRETLAAAPLRDRAPDPLRGRIEAMLETETGVSARPPLAASRPSSGLAAHVLSGRWASGAVAGALAASLALVVGLPQLTQTDTEDQLVQSHVRSLLVGHVVDVETSNRHVVKPWFNGKVDFAPSVPELADEGFPLVGGRLDYVDDHEVAAIVYRRRLHTINLFVRPAKTLSSPIGFASRREGYNIVHWSAGGLDYWAISDLDSRELGMFRRLYTDRAER